MKSPKKNPYLNDFKINEEGKYEYRGKHYVFAGDGQQQKQTYLRLWLMLTAAAAAIVGSGFINAAGMSNTFYVILPYLGELCAFFALMWNHFKLLTKGDEIREYVYRQAHPKIPVACAICAFFSVVSLVTAGVYSVISGFEGGVAMCILYLVLKVAAAAVILFYRNYFIQAEWIILE